MTNGLGVTTLARWTAALLVVSAVLFALALALERRGESHETRDAVAGSRGGEGSGHVANQQAETKRSEGGSEGAEAAHSEAREAAEHAEAGAHNGERAEHVDAAHTESEEAPGHSEERLFGVDLENPWLVWGFVGASFLLALAVLRLWTPAILLAVLLAAVAALLDVREVSMQFRRANDLIAGLASLIALLHLAAAAMALLAWRAQVGRRKPSRK